MKKYFAALAIGVFFPVSVLAFAPGTYTAKLNLNIRSLPSMSGSLIGHYNQGDTVTVLSVIGSWCKVPYKNYNAYVYCNILAPTGTVQATTTTTTTTTTTPPPASVITNGLVTQNLKSTHNWLITDNVGINYINDSYFEANQLAYKWDGEPKIADFYFQWPLLSDSKCSLIFSGPFHANSVFKAECFDNVGMIKTWTESTDKPLATYNLPKLPFKNFVEKLLADTSVMADFDTYFAKADHIKGLFRLYKGVGGVDFWEGKFIDEDSGYFMIVSVDAGRTDGNFIIEKGRFQ